MNIFDLRPTLIALAVGLVVGSMGGCWAAKKLTKPEIRTEIQEKEVIRTDIRTVTRTVERPDGSKETVVETVDKTKSVASKQAVVEVSKPNWSAGVAVESDYKLQPVYEVELNRRVFGPIYIGVSANTDAEFGIRLNVEF